MKKVSVEVFFVDDNNKIAEKDKKILRNKCIDVMKEYVNYVNGEIIK